MFNLKLLSYSLVLDLVTLRYEERLEEDQVVVVSRDLTQDDHEQVQKSTAEHFEQVRRSAPSFFCGWHDFKDFKAVMSFFLEVKAATWRVDADLFAAFDTKV